MISSKENNNEKIPGRYPASFIWFNIDIDASLARGYQGP